MATILYLSNKLVQVVEAKTKGKTVVVQNVWQGEAPQDSIINGIITDEEAFLKWIDEFFETNKLSRKEVSLVVNSSQFNSKVLEFPKVRDAELRKMIPREFAELKTENTLFTYSLLETEKNGKKQKLFATAVEKEFLASYIQLLKQVRIELVSIDSEIGSLVTLCMHSPEIQKKTCLVQILDGNEVISMLFVKGVYYYSQKNRLLNQDSEEGISGELNAIRDRLLQFMTSQQIKEPIETFYLCGEGQSIVKRDMPDDRTFVGDKVVFVEKPVKKKKIEYIYPIGSLLQKKQDASFFKQLRQEQKERKRQREVIQWLLPSLVVLLVGLVIFLILGNQYMSGDKELKRLQAVMQENETLNDNASYELAAANVDNMKGRINAVEEIWAHLMSYPTLNSKIEDLLLDCAGNDVRVTIRSFQRDSGILTLEATTGNVRAINEFIAKLQEQTIFKSVEYSGYSYISGPDIYNIHVVCCMAESAGR